MEEGNRIEDIEFMEEILEKRSKIEETADKQEIEEMKAENDVIIKDYLQNIAEKLEKKNYKEALELVERSKYFTRIDEALHDWIDKHTVY